MTQELSTTEAKQVEQADKKICTMCHENERAPGLLVCHPCYYSFDGDRRCFWDDEDY